MANGNGTKVFDALLKFGVAAALAASGYFFASINVIKREASHLDTRVAVVEQTRFTSANGRQMEREWAGAVSELSERLARMEVQLETIQKTLETR